jgi:hypothetical protein
MPQNDFVPFATGAGANVYSVATYAAAAARQTGVVGGTADPLLANNSWRQGTVVASMIGQFITSAGYDALDNGDLTTLLVNFQSAITALAQSGAPGSTSLVHSGTDTSGTANQITLSTVTPDISALQDFQLFEIVPANNVTGPVTLTIKAFGGLPLLRRNGGQLVSGDAPAGAPLLAMKYGNTFRLLVAVPSEITTTAITVIQARRIAGSTPYRYASSGNYTLAVPAGTIFSIAECRGGGGGGGGANGTNAAGSGGGGGGNAAKVGQAITDTVLAITVGAGGSPGSAGGGNAGSGGTSLVSVQSGTVQGTNGTTFTAGQTLCAATGGTGGYGGVGGNQGTQQGLGGVASGGDLNDNGDSGGYPPQVGTYSFGGSGGASPGSGGRPDNNYAAAGNSSSAAGTGGNGSSANAIGGYGTPGRVTIYQ